MKESVKRVFKRLFRLVKSDKSTLHKFNYLTLKIDSPEITKDLFQHSIDQKISLFWIGVILSLINFSANLLSFFQSGKTIYGRIYLSLIFLVVLGPVFALLKWRFKRGVRYLPIIFFLVYAGYFCMGVLWSQGHVLLTGVEEVSDQIEALHFAYIMCTFILCQSDFKIALFGVFPLYLVSAFILNLQGKRSY
jgi:hypothetical protein